MLFAIQAINYTDHQLHKLLATQGHQPNKLLAIQVIKYTD